MTTTKSRPRMVIDHDETPNRVVSLTATAAVPVTPTAPKSQLNARIDDGVRAKWKVYAAQRRMKEGDLAEQALIEFMANHPVE